MSVTLQRLVLVMVAANFKTVTSYSNGKLTDACKTMIPYHGYDSSTDIPPYILTVNKKIFSPGDQIKVTLSTSMPGTTHFKGFLIEAQDTEDPDGYAVGLFSLVNPTLAQLLRCDHRKGSAVSHTSDAPKTEVHVIWNAPKKAPPSVQFRMTVVQHYKVYWVKIPGPVVSQNGITPGPFQPTSITGVNTSPAVLPNPFSSVGCGSRKSCLRDPVECDPGTDQGCFFLSFAKEGETVVFELSGPADGYMSFGLSLDQWMGNDDVYLCIRDDTRVDISAAYVRGRTHPMQPSRSVLTDTTWSLSNGVMKCRFRRNIYIPQDCTRFHLNESYYLFMAHGRAENGMIHRHDRQPLISSNQKLISGAPENICGSRSSVTIKFHGGLMLIAWMTTASTAIFIARYFKPDWPDRSLFGLRVWFQVHQTLMVLTVLLTSLGFILPFVYRRGWSQHAGAHSYLGSIVMALTLIQPLMAIFRPQTGSSRRWIFNWMHLGTGIIAQILAAFAIFLGIHQPVLLLPGPWATGVLALLVVLGVATGLALELHSKGLCVAGKAESSDEEIILSCPSGRDNEETQFKKIVLTVFLCGNIGFLTVFLYFISNV